MRPICGKYKISWQKIHKLLKNRLLPEINRGGACFLRRMPSLRKSAEETIFHYSFRKVNIVFQKNQKTLKNRKILFVKKPMV